MESTGNFDVFISYRRKGGFETGKLVYYSLQQRGYRVFLDVEALRSGPFNKQLYNVIDSVSDFVLILSKDALERCNNEGDWVREEILRAIKSNKNIIPIIQNDFKFPEPMPPGLEGLEYYNGVVASIDYFDAAMDKLATMLKATPRSSRETRVNADHEFSNMEKIIKILLHAGDFESVKKKCAEALNNYKNQAMLYVYQLLAEAKINDESKLYLFKTPQSGLESNPDFQLALEFASDREKAYLDEMIEKQHIVKSDLRKIVNCICNHLDKRIAEINDCIHLITSPQLNLRLYDFIQDSISEPRYVALEIDYPEDGLSHYATSEFLMTNSFMIKIILTVRDNYCEFTTRNIIEKISTKVLDILRDAPDGYIELSDVNREFIFENFKKYNSEANDSQVIKLYSKNVSVDNILFTRDKKAGVAFLSMNNLRFVDTSKE